MLDVYLYRIVCYSPWSRDDLAGTGGDGKPVARIHRLVLARSNNWHACAWHLPRVCHRYMFDRILIEVDPISLWLWQDFKSNQSDLDRLGEGVSAPDNRVDWVRMRPIQPICVNRALALPSFPSHRAIHLPCSFTILAEELLPVKRS